MRWMGSIQLHCDRHLSGHHYLHDGGALIAGNEGLEDRRRSKERRASRERRNSGTRKQVMFRPASTSTSSLTSSSVINETGGGGGAGDKRGRDSNQDDESNQTGSEYKPERVVREIVVDDLRSTFAVFEVEDLPGYIRIEVTHSMASLIYRFHFVAIKLTVMYKLILLLPFHEQNENK